MVASQYSSPDRSMGGLFNQLSMDQRQVAHLLGGGTKLESLVLGLHGFCINDNPQDREVFVNCPHC